jgi:predicted MFS family arabinose efflux permease
VLAGDAGGWRLGLGVLQQRGVVAWLRAWDSLPGPVSGAQPSEPARPVAGSGEQLVAALATMALCCLAARK